MANKLSQADIVRMLRLPETNSKPKTGPVQVIEDRVQFRMPRDKELQFCAMSALQQFVATYDDRMKVHNVGGNDRYRFELQYDVDIPYDDWIFFRTVGLELSKTATPIDLSVTQPDMVVDMSDEKLERFKNNGIHASQACGFITGVPALSLPVVHRTKPSIEEPYEWRSLDELTAEDIVGIRDGEVSGMFGIASRNTYLASCIGFPVIELVNDDRPDLWLSKFSNKGYRVIRTQGMTMGQVADMIKFARKSIEVQLDWYRTQKQ